MARKRSPPADKQLDYEKQQRGFTEYTQSFRHGKWRKKKRRPAQQAERQQERLAVSAPSADALRDPGFDPGPIVRPRIVKWSPAPLAVSVEKKKLARVNREGGKQRRRAARTRPRSA